MKAWCCILKVCGQISRNFPHFFSQLSVLWKIAEEEAIPYILSWWRLGRDGAGMATEHSIWDSGLWTQRLASPNRKCRSKSKVKGVNPHLQDTLQNMRKTKQVNEKQSKWTYKNCCTKCGAGSGCDVLMFSAERKWPDPAPSRAEEPSCRKWGIDLLSCLPPPPPSPPPPPWQMNYSTFASFNKLHFSPIHHLQLWYSLFCLGTLPSNCYKVPC